ncbi:MAG: 1,2-phenylacetyl-CoA epoxidase subunit PaaA [Dehalococcoidia bacterium]
MTTATAIDQRTAAFKCFVQDGGQVEATDWMPDEYRRRLIRFIEMHANSEIMGALPERDWIAKAPSLKRKLGLTAKIQDEVGHAQLIYLVSGKSKFHNVFHYPTRSWGDVGAISWLVDGAAILSQSGLLRCSYAPYARIMKRVCWEEAVHLKHGEDICLTLAGGTPMQKAMLQEAIDRWWEPLLMFHGPPTPLEKDGDLAWRIKGKDNESLRQEFLDRYVPQLREIGLTVPDEQVRKDPETGRWHYTEPDWTALAAIGNGGGPASRERLGFRRMTYEQGEWVRRTVLQAAAAA